MVPSCEDNGEEDMRDCEKVEGEEEEEGDLVKLGLEAFQSACCFDWVSVANLDHCQGNCTNDCDPCVPNGPSLGNKGLGIFDGFWMGLVERVGVGKSKAKLEGPLRHAIPGKQHTEQT